MKVKVTSWDAIAFPFQCIVLGTLAVIAVVLIVPIVVALEVRACLARHRIRKEALARQAEGL